MILKPNLLLEMPRDRKSTTPSSCFEYAVAVVAVATRKRRRESTKPDAAARGRAAAAGPAASDANN